MSPASISGSHILFLFLSLILSIIIPPSSQSDPRQILLKFKTNLSSANTQLLTTWNENNPVCNFTGIVCDDKNTVTGINLSEQKLEGTLDFDSLCSLESLRKVSIGDNLLHGAISSNLSQCTRLQHLDLGNNSFTGKFPDISSLTHLRHLSLGLTRFSGQFPWKSLPNLTKLVFLSLSDTTFDKTQFPLEILTLGKLQVLDLGNCNIHGTIPEEIGHLVLFQWLSLFENYLVGEIPKGITKLVNLEVLNLYNNHLTGGFPIGFRNLVMLYYLDVSRNSLEGDLSELRNLTRMEFLLLSQNKFSGQFPGKLLSELTNLTYLLLDDNLFDKTQFPLEILTLRKLQVLDLGNCSIHGTIPEEIGKLKSLQQIKISYNYLVGEIPKGITKLENLESLILYDNRLTGGFPIGFGNMVMLSTLDVSNNSLKGDLSVLRNLTRMEFLLLPSNNFSGQFPWRSLNKLTDLRYLILADNPLDKTQFPLEILTLTKLQILDLANCNIQGTIPEEIGKLKWLQQLKLSHNHLVGEIPKGITKLENLEVINLYNNRLTRGFPKGFRNLVMLSSLDVSNNSLEGDLSELRSLSRMEALLLYENKFSGKVPEEFGEFRFLQEFSIYRNKFTGELPEKIGSWADFLLIDASENFLTGSIPPYMCKKGKFKKLLMVQNNFTGGLSETYANCSSLTRLRVSNNSLSGRIPNGIWSLPRLEMIDLAMNQFEGEVTQNIGEANSLAQLYLYNNRFSGELPEEISKVSSLVEMELMYNQFSGRIPERIGDLKNLNSLHLEGNLFSGSIPETLGSCVSLNDINLAENSLSGNIPASLGSLTGLNSLNMSNNKLSGVIPSSLSLPKLSLIDLSNNMLTGRVPESLLAEAYDDSFQGNPGLCADKKSKSLRQCSMDSRHSKGLGVARYFFIVGAIVLVLVLVLVLVFLVAYFLIVKSWAKDCNNITVSEFHGISFDKGEILGSLKPNNLIGKGGSGKVYKVELRCGTKLAVKHLWRSGKDYNDRRSYSSSAKIIPKQKSRWPEYDAEVATLSSIQHANVVKLYCSITHDNSKLLVYEYMPNGSLWDQLHTYQTNEMNWNLRYKIAVGVAKGLKHLHHGCDRPVIHRDVKSSNILLDEEMQPKIADFGLAKIMQMNKVTNSSHIIAGTYGYIAPEYGNTFNVTEKSDVYSFGVVLMELVTRRKPIETEFGENKDIVSWVHDEMRIKDKMTELVDPNISNESKRDAMKVLTIAIRCTKQLPSERPSMRVVVQMLEHIESRSPIGIVIDNIINA